MKSIIKILPFLSLFILTLSCGPQHDTASTKVTLDNGKRWIANPETTAGINNMRAQMSGFTGSDNAAYTKLKDDLMVEYRLIFKNCTMKGEAHEQLHNYLVPMQEMIDGLASADLTVSKENFDKLNAHLGEYVTYFE